MVRPLVLLGPLRDPFNPAAYRDRAALRRELGYPQNQPLLVVAVGARRPAPACWN